MFIELTIQSNLIPVRYRLSCSEYSIFFSTFTAHNLREESSAFVTINISTTTFSLLYYLQLVTNEQDTCFNTQSHWSSVEKIPARYQLQVLHTVLPITGHTLKGEACL